jgi:hypothetical protein
MSTYLCIPATFSDTHSYTYMYICTYFIECSNPNLHWGRKSPHQLGTWDLGLGQTPKYAALILLNGT